MGRAPCCSKVGLHRGAWSTEEDKLLTDHIQTHGEGHWRDMPSKAGLLRCGKSCRLRWMNYLRPGIRRGNFTDDENEAIMNLHSIHGNRWSFIATKLSKKKVKVATEKDVEIVHNEPDVSPTSPLSLRKNVSFDNGVTTSGASSSCTFEPDVVTADFRWPEVFEIDGASSFDDLNMDGLDLMMLKDDESEMLEKLYDECWHLIQDGDENM
ncbi:hypothetical protein OSB04_022331 [Centaurea solstitialis]|uniref:Uncharacterized protein n=1 Tax=Centaurea solstitialis TaxID=347529 RepID=A0AA38TFR7_9ASTR|nr:hypothetical protein OSB04_022331 [Centaurea solstitialis]